MTQAFTLATQPTLEPGGSNPGVDYYAVTPSASAQPCPFRMIYVGGAGNVVLQNAAGTAVTFTAVPVGQYIYCTGSYVLTASTATLMVAIV